MGYLAFDLEIKEDVDGKRRSWADARAGRCGVSVLCVYDSDMDQYLFFDDHNLGEGMAYLRNADFLVGFNSKEFDLPCLEGYTGESLAGVPHVDLLQVVWSALGRRQKGYKLDDICRRTLGTGKAGDGIFATTLWAENRIAELYTYCLFDVTLTKRLVDFVLKHGYIIDTLGHELEVDLGGLVETGEPIPEL